VICTGGNLRDRLARHVGQLGDGNSTLTQEPDRRIQEHAARAKDRKWRGFYRMTVKVLKHVRRCRIRCSASQGPHTHPLPLTHPDKCREFY
jgi:hypothetical protein